jgi:hypothetical protein
VKSYYAGKVLILQVVTPLRLLTFTTLKGVEVVQDPDQNSTDLMKCFQSINALGEEQNTLVCTR